MKPNKKAVFLITAVSVVALTIAGCNGITGSQPAAIAAAQPAGAPATPPTSAPSPTPGCVPQDVLSPAVSAATLFYAQWNDPSNNQQLDAIRLGETTGALTLLKPSLEPQISFNSANDHFLFRKDFPASGITTQRSNGHIATYRFDAATAVVTQVADFAEPDGTTIDAVTASRDGHCLFASGHVDAAAPGGMLTPQFSTYTFSIAADGSLQPTGNVVQADSYQFSDSSNTIDEMFSGPIGGLIFAARTISGPFTNDHESQTLRINGDGSITELPGFLPPTAGGDADYFRRIAMTPDSRFVVTLSAKQVDVISVNHDGQTSLLGTPFAITDGNPQRNQILSTLFFAGNDLVYRYDGAFMVHGLHIGSDGTLTPVAGDAALASGTPIGASLSGKYLLVARIAGSGDAVSISALDSYRVNDDGTLELQSSVPFARYYPAPPVVLRVPSN